MGSKYSRFEIDRLKDSADIRKVIPGCNERKADQKVTCPFCGADTFGVVHKGGKNFAHCFSCEKGFSNAVAAVMHYNGFDKSRYVEALELTARTCGLVLTPETEIKAASVRQTAEALIFGTP